MSVSAKRLSGGRSTAGSPALVNAALLLVALIYGFWLLVSRGQMTWPPGRLFANVYTVAGCLALVGPIVLARRDPSDAGLGDLVWMTGGVLVWISNVAALIRGTFQPASLPTPLSHQAMGLAMLAVLIAGCRIHGTGRAWSWTNVVGWVLGLFWVGMGLASLSPGAAVALRG